VSQGPRALVAPDKFKGTIEAADVAEAVAVGLDIECDICPIADGGEGTAAILLRAIGGTWRLAPATDPLGREIECRFALLAGGEEAIVEVAEASGLWRLEPGELDPIGASSAGTGQLIAAAIEAGAKRVLVACGGSATTDGGAGALSRFDPGAAELVCLCDTDVPFPAAASVYSPQKGAGPEQVAELEDRLARMSAELPHDPSRLPFTGAAGGLSGGLWAHGARLVPGARHVLAAIGFDERLRGASMLVTGEGRLDETTLRGKAVGEVARRADASGVPCHAIVGADALEGAGRDLFASVQEAGDLAGIERAARRIAG
jgi:glycerate kinase